jgi:hypothetical protein
MYSGHAFVTTRCALYDPSTNTWATTGSLLRSSRRTATLLCSVRCCPSVAATQNCTLLKRAGAADAIDYW